MPTTLTRACQHYGCPHPAETCPDHGRKAKQKHYDDHRGSRHERGYGPDWDACKAQFLSALWRLNIPEVCGARLPGAPVTTDSDCAARKATVRYGVVDHIKPIAGKNDPDRLNLLNLQLLCDGKNGGFGCHDRKRQRERPR